MPYNHWFVSRQKRQLTSVFPALLAFSDVCVGKVWNRELQLEFEDALGGRYIIDHGDLRARRVGDGGGGGRTLFKQMRDLGLVFLENNNKKCRLTLIGEEIVKGRILYVEAMRLQLQRYQYPSATAWKGSGRIDHRFRVHPFQFIFRLLRDERLENTLNMDEMSGIVIHKACSDNVNTYEDVVSRILSYRQNNYTEFVADTPKGKYRDIANTLFNYISITQYVDRGNRSLMIRSGKEHEVDAFIETDPILIPHPESTENYQRAFGRGTAARDSRRFDREHVVTENELRESRIMREYSLLSLQRPIAEITPDIVIEISHKTGYDEMVVERFLIQNHHNGNIDEFFSYYRDLAYMGTAGAAAFESATCEIFRNIFHMRAEHVGPIGNTPDVFAESAEAAFCCIIDNKAYKNGYSITGNNKRVMEDVYIPNYQLYGQTEQPLAFYAYIAGSFGNTINRQLAEISRDTGINGSAMPVDVFIMLAQNYAENNYDHQFLRRIFSLNREITIADLQ